MEIRDRMSLLGHVSAVGVALCVLLPAGASAQYRLGVTTEKVSPDAELRPALPMSNAQRQVLLEKYLARREAMDLANASPMVAVEQPGAERGREAVEGPPAPEADFHTPPVGAAKDPYLGRNNQNPQANGALASNWAQTSAVNEGPHIFYTGNTHAEYSTNGGTSYNNVAIPAGPATAPNACCDLDVIYDKGRGVTFWSVLYTDAAVSQGSVRIFVRRHIPSGNNCSSTYTPGAGILPDYAHLGLSNDFLYLTTIEGSTHKIRRYNLDELVDCVPTTVDNISVTPAVGHRAVVPVEGATDTMYWAYHESSTVIRIYYWRETAASPSSATQTINAHNHSNPDCRGGTNNTDWIEGSASYSITGFRMRGAVGGGELGFFWNVSSDASHTQAHVHAVIVRDIPALGFPILSQPHIFNNSSCIAYPAVGVNERGDWGMVVGWGGVSGGGGVAVHTNFSIRDDYDTGFLVHTPFATGTHNPASSLPRWGGYQSVRRHQACGMAWSGTGYAHNGGTGVANINARYIEFMRGRDYQCYVQWRDEVPETP